MAFDPDLFVTQQPFILFNNKDNSVCLDTAAGAGSDVDGQADNSELNDLFANFPYGWNPVRPVNLNDWAAGGGGQDLMHGEGGDDVIYGGTGFNLSNNMYSAPGQEPYDLAELGIIHSIATYDFAADTLYGDQGDDALFGQAGFDQLDGGSGDDLLYGGTQGDTMHGGEYDGCDPVFINEVNPFSPGYNNGFGYTFESSGEDVMYGERGCDLMYGGNEYEFLSRDDRNYAGDFMSGNRGYDTMYGGDGSDTMGGGKLDDLMYGEGDTDYMKGGMDCDTMYGGDEFHYWQSSNCFYDGFGDTMYGDNDLNGNSEPPADGDGHGDDEMYGGYGDDLMYGQGGDDIMEGNADDDVMHGQDGDDEMDGGTGCDLMTGGYGNDGMVGGEDNDTMEGNQGHDDMEGNAGNDAMTGGEGNDDMQGNAGDDDMEGNDGEDEMYGNDGQDQMCGNADDDYMDGGDGADRMGGGTGDDEMYGGDESGTGAIYDWRHPSYDVGDTMNGGEGDDYVDGEGGNDELYGGAGIDTLIGGDGDDTINSGEGATVEDIMNDHWEEVDLSGGGNDTFVYEFAFSEAEEDEGNTAVGTDGYVAVIGFDNEGDGDTLVLCNIGDEISEAGCDGNDGCGDDPDWNRLNNLITPNAEGQHAVVVKDNGVDTLIFFDDTTTPEDPSDPQILKNETILLEGVTGVGTEFGQFQDLHSLNEAGYNIVVQNGPCPDFIVCQEDPDLPDTFS